MNDRARIVSCDGRRGVTLLELLTVIALIAILLAIIFPVFSRAKEAARVTACANNVRQIAFAMGAYAADWGGLPWSEDPLNPGKPVGAKDFPALHDCARRYIINTGVCQCPSDRETRAGIGNAEQDKEASVRASYDVLTAWTIQITKSEWSGIRNLTRVPLAWDLHGGLSRERAAALSDSERIAAIRAANHFSRGGNVAYADMHVAWKNAQEWNDTNDPGIPRSLRAF